MTAPHEDLLALATAYALDAVDDAERADIERRVRAAPDDVSAAFALEVRQVREAMAQVSTTTAAEPPGAPAEPPPRGDNHRPGARRCGNCARPGGGGPPRSPPRRRPSSSA